MSYLTRADFEAEARRLAGRVLTSKEGQSGRCVGMHRLEQHLLCASDNPTSTPNYECASYGYYPLPGGSTTGRWAFTLQELTHVDGVPYVQPKPVVLPAPVPRRLQVGDPPPVITPSPALLRYSASRALTFLSSLNLQDQPRDVQREQRAVVGELMAALGGERGRT